VSLDAASSELRDAVDVHGVFESAPVAMAVLDAHGLPVAHNRRFREMFDLSSASGSGCWSVVDDRNRERTLEAVADVASRRRELAELDQQHRRRDGSLMHARLTLSPLEQHGATTPVVVAAVDVSHEHDQQVSLDGAHRRLEAMLANISDTVTLVDERGVVIETTGLHTSIMGYETDYWKRRSVFDLVDHDDLPRLLTAYEQVMASPGEQVTLDLRVLQADEQWADIELTAVNLLDDPSLGGIVITSRNITERKRIESELADHRDAALEQVRLRSEFVARVSHELRNQLHALRGLTELLATTEVPRSVAQLVDTAHRQAERFGHLVEDLLEYSSFEAGRAEVRATPCWPRQLAADAIAVAHELAADGVQVALSTGEDVPDVVLVDERRLLQVLTNLLSNAAKFTREGRIELHATSVVDDGVASLRWSVRDTGRGIPSEDLERIFAPFDQGSAAASAQGSGLGLAITERIVSTLGGRVEVRSTVGVGSEFCVTVPVDPCEAAPSSGAPIAPQLRPRAQVLVVEDNEVNQLLVAEQLARLGVRATVVGSGVEALERLEGEHGFDCVLMDWQLPELDGVEATRRQRAREAPQRRVPIVGMSASGRPGDRATCRDAGMDELLVKPVSLADLGRALQPFLGERRAVPRRSVDAAAADTDALDALVQQLGSVAPVRSIVATFLSELDQREAAILDSVERGDQELLQRTAHTLRSMSATLGANELDELARTLELGAHPPSGATVEAFRESVTRTRAALQRWSARQEHPGRPSS
jgi:PAS domain S-box-containing protein